MMEAAFLSMGPLIFAALGGLLSQRAGVLNISLEGCIGAGAFTAAMLIKSGSSLGAAFMGAILIGVLSGSLLGAFHLNLGADLFISGLGINLLLPSLAGLISQDLFGQQGVIRFPPQDTNIFPWLSISMACITGLMLRYSSYGRNVRTAGYGGEFLQERGISIKSVRMSVLMASSGLAALAGAILSLRIGAFVPGMSAGKGWIALVMIWMGLRHPLGVLISCYLFTLFEIASGRIQGMPAGMGTLIPALPYFAALLMLILISPRGSNRD